MLRSLLGAVLLLTLFHSSPVYLAAADDAKKVDVKVAGLLFDKKDDWITVKADGEDDPVKYFIAKDADKKMVEGLKTIFGASRVQLTYKKDGDTRQLVSIKKQILKASGTVTGSVVKVHNDFWVEVKPKDGLADGYAPGATNYNDKEFMAKLKGLKNGDSVTISFNTDGERHRILTLKINSVSPEEVKVAGILIERKDNWLSVKADGEAETVKYVVAKDADKKLVESLKTAFNASRVQLTYKKDKDSRQLLSIKKQALKESGTVTGVVVKVYNDSWIEVKHRTLQEPQLPQHEQLGQGRPPSVPVPKSLLRSGINPIAQPTRALPLSQNRKDRQSIRG